MKSFVVFLIFGISSTLSAPTDVKQYSSNLFDSDKRVENLKKYRYVSGLCKNVKKQNNFTDSLCFAIYDVALSYNLKKLQLNEADSQIETIKVDEFCTKLENSLSETPLNSENKVIVDQVPWLKDVLKEKDGQDQCTKECLYESPDTYEISIKPVCRFLYHQLPTLTPKLHRVELVKEIDLSETAAEKPNANKTINDGASTTVAKNIAEIFPPVPVVPIEPIKSSENITTNISMNSTKPIPSSPTDKLTSVVTVPTKVDASKNVVIDETQKQLYVLDKDDDKKKLSNVDNDLLNENEDLDDPFGNQSSAVPAEVAGEKNDEDYDEDALPEENREELKQAQDSQNGQNQIDHGLPNEQNPTPKIVDVDFQEDPDSNFFAYLCGVMFLCIFLYILQQNRHKLLALCLEGRRGNRRGRERSRGGSKAAYSKLDCNLEEAIMSKKSLNGKSMDIIY